MRRGMQTRRVCSPVCSCKRLPKWESGGGSYARTCSPTSGARAWTQCVGRGALAMARWCAAGGALERERIVVLIRLLRLLLVSSLLRSTHPSLTRCRLIKKTKAGLPSWRKRPLTTVSSCEGGVRRSKPSREKKPDLRSLSETSSQSLLPRSSNAAASA